MRLLYIKPRDMKLQILLFKYVHIFNQIYFLQECKNSKLLIHQVILILLQGYLDFFKNIHGFLKMNLTLSVLTLWSGLMF